MRPPRPLAVATALLAAAALVFAGCGGDDTSSGGSSTTATTETHDEHAGHDDAATTAPEVLFPPQEAPELGLRDHLGGGPVTIAQMRGKATFVMFVYSQCPDVCPVIVSNMRRALVRLGPRAKDVNVVAVSVDPKGDTRDTVTSYLKAQKMTGRMRWLVGTREELEAVWQRWGIATQVPKDNPELVEHAAPIYGVNASGTISTIYDVNISSSDVVADVPDLAAG